MSRIAVVGAGVGGLAVAARLARMGHVVTVLEQAETVGGKLGIVEAEGFRFDTGPSIVTMPDVFRELWAFLGINETFDAQARLRRLDPIARYRFGDGTWLDAAADHESFLANVEHLQVGNATEMRAFLARAERIWDTTHEPFLESPLRGVRTLLKLSTRLRDLRTIAPGLTLRHLAVKELSDPRLVNFIDRYATYTGSDPRKSPAALASIPFVERSYGGWYVEGGLRRIAELLEGHCQELGVDIRCSTNVAAIATDNQGRASGVQLADGSVHAYDIVVANADARHLYRDLLATSKRARKALRSLERAEPSLSGFVMLLGVKGKTPELEHHNVMFPKHYDDEFDDLFGTRRTKPQIVRDPTIYLSVPSDSAVAPIGHQAWFVLVNAPRHSPNDPSTGVDWTAEGVADVYGDRLLSLMAERGVDIRDRIVFRAHRTPADLEFTTRSVGGSIYGTSSNGMRAAFLRPTNQSPIPNLYLVGGSSHPGGGLPLVTLSAKIVANLIGSSTNRSNGHSTSPWNQPINARCPNP